MGFDSAIYKAKKLDANTTYKEIEYFNQYFNYMNNDWAKTNYKTFDDYCKAMEIEKSDIDNYDNKLNFYKEQYKYKENQYGSNIFDELWSWCSSSIFFYEWLRENFDFENYSTLIITNEIAKKCLTYICEELNKCKFKKVIIEHSFIKDYENEENNDDIILKKCTGVEARDANGNIRRIDTDDFEYSEVFIPENYFDEDKFDVLYSLMTTFIELICNTDWENECVIYSGGW